MKRILLTMLIFLALFSSVGLADWNCLNASFSQYSTTLTVSSSNVPLSYPKNCTLSGGCNPFTGECYPSPYDVSLGSIGILFSILILGVVFFIISIMVQDEAYKIFYNITSLLFFLGTLLVDISFIYNLNVSSSIGFVSDMLWIILAALILAIGFMFLNLLNDLISIISGKRKLKK